MVRLPVVPAAAACCVPKPSLLLVLLQVWRLQVCPGLLLLSLCCCFWQHVFCWCCCHASAPPTTHCGVGIPSASPLLPAHSGPLLPLLLQLWACVLYLLMLLLAARSLPSHCCHWCSPSSASRQSPGPFAVPIHVTFVVGGADCHRVPPPLRFGSSGGHTDEPTAGGGADSDCGACCCCG
jgi:hypothetical protein